MEPNFPFGSVSKNVQHGFEVYQEYGLLTEQEYGKIAGHLPQELQNKGPSVVKLPYMSPSANSNYYLVDLLDVEAHVVASIRKVRIYYNVCTELQVAILEHGKQLTKDHARAVYSHAVDKEQSQRPAPLKPSANRPQSLDAFVQKFQGLADAAEAAAAVKSEPEPDEAEAGGSDNGDEQKQKQGNPDRAMGLFFDDDDMPKPKKKAKAAGKGSAASAATPASTASPAGPSVVPTPSKSKLEAVETNSASTVGKTKGFQNLDKDMTFVAQRHLLNCPTSKATSLEHLYPVKFLLEPSKQLSNSLSGVRA